MESKSRQDSLCFVLRRGNIPPYKTNNQTKEQNRTLKDYVSH